jgi:CBS domain-containing protein
MKTVADAMTTPPVVVATSTSVQEASSAMLQRRAQVAIVTRDERVWGLVTAPDVARALADGLDATTTPVEAIAEPDPQPARPQESLAGVHQRMRLESRGTVPVVGRAGEPLGVLVDPEA